MDEIYVIKLDKDVAEGIQILYEELGDTFILVGAAARDIVLAAHKLTPERATRDTDLAIRVKSWEIYESLREKLTERGFIEKRARYNFSYKQAVFDIFPFGEITSGKSEILWPQDGKVMSVLGFEEAFKTCHRFELSGKLQLRIASLASLVMLKIISWSDRPHERSQDPLDISTIIYKYIDAGNSDRLYDDHSSIADMETYTLERAGAALLGRDLKILCSPMTLLKVSDILENELNDVESSVFFSQMSRSRPFESQVDLVRLMLSEMKAYLPLG